MDTLEDFYKASSKRLISWSSDLFERTEFLWKENSEIRFLVESSWHESGIFHGFCDASLDVSLGASAVVAQKKILLLEQVHGSEISHGTSERADGILLSDEDSSGGVRTADCTPCLLHDPETRFSAALHCGWRSTVDGIVYKALDQYNVETVEVRIGPSAKECCYEIGPDLLAPVLDSLHTIEGTSIELPRFLFERKGKLFLSVSDLVIAQCLLAGVVPDNIRHSDVCTICNTNFNSHRRDPKNTCRQLSFIGVKTI